MKETRTPIPLKSRRFRRAGAVVSAGLLAGLIAAGIGGVASAQSVEITDLDTTSTAQVEGEEGDADLDEYEPSTEDQAIWEQFENCLQESGINLDADENAQDEAALDAAFEKCDPLLEGLSDAGGFDGDTIELSPADEAVFERYEQCLTNAGLDLEGDEESFENLDESTLDAAFEQCDPILDELSEDFDGGEFDGDFDEFSAEDEAVFERYDQCLTDAGLSEESYESLDEAAIDAAFNACDPILEELSEDAQAMFEECPDEHAEDSDNDSDVEGS